MKSPISRRRFMQQSAKGAIAAAVIPSILGSRADKAFALVGIEEMTLPDYYRRFDVDEKIIQDVMAQALSHDGDVLFAGVGDATPKSRLLHLR